MELIDYFYNSAVVCHIKKYIFQADDYYYQETKPLEQSNNDRKINTLKG